MTPDYFENVQARLHTHRKAANLRFSANNLLERVLKLADSAIPNSQSMLNFDVREFGSRTLIGCPCRLIGCPHRLS